MERVGQMSTPSVAVTVLGLPDSAIQPSVPPSQPRAGLTLGGSLPLALPLPDPLNTKSPTHFTYPSDLAGLATQCSLASLSSPRSQPALEIPEGLSAPAGLSFQLMKGHLPHLLHLSFQDVLN